jgi:hypothetical protein
VSSFLVHERAHNFFEFFSEFAQLPEVYMHGHAIAAAAAVGAGTSMLFVLMSAAPGFKQPATVPLLSSMLVFFYSSAMYETWQTCMSVALLFCAAL